MTILLERPTTGALDTTAEMSAADHKFDSKEEVRTMTATTARPRPHGLDRAVMRLSLAMMIWVHKRDARKRSERFAMSHELRARRVSQALAIEAREHDAALLVARIR